MNTVEIIFSPTGGTEKSPISLADSEMKTLSKLI